MASGMEMMMGSMLKNMGLDPQALLGMVNNAGETIKGMDARFSALEKNIGLVLQQQQLIIAQNDRILSGTSYDRTGIVPAGQTSLFAEHDAGYSALDMQAEHAMGLRITEARPALEAVSVS